MAFLNRFWTILILVLPLGGLFAQEIIETPDNSFGELPVTTMLVGNQIQIITKKQIEKSGYSQLSDLFQLFENWNLTTYNGNKWAVQGNGNGDYVSQNWQLLVNGVRVDLLTWDAKNINSLGFTVQDIERIEVINAQGLYFGEFNDKGTIHFFTKTPVEGLSVRMMISNGNEIGDPHLDVVNNPQLNVHEFGTTMGGYIGFRKKRWQVESSQNFATFFYRDTSRYMQKLVGNIYPFPSFGNELVSSRTSVTYSGIKATHQLVFHGHRGGDVVTPQQVDSPFVISERNTSLSYQFKWKSAFGELGSRLRITNRHTDDVVFSIHQQRYKSVHANVYLKFNQKANKRGQINELGVSAESFSFDANQVLANGSASYFIRPYLSYTYNFSKRRQLFSDFAVSANQTGVLPRMAIGINSRLSDRYQWSIITAFSQRFSAENNDYIFFLSQIQPFEILAELPTLKTIDYTSHWKLTETLEFNFGTGLKELANNYHFLTVEGVLHPSISNKFLTKSDVLRWVNHLNLHYKNNLNFDLELNYLNMNAVANAEAFHKNVPTHKVTVMATFNLPARFSIWTGYYYQSATTWQNSNLVLQNSFSENLPDFVQIRALNFFDFGLNKKLLKDYLTINLTMRNVFNQNEQFQQFGAAFYTRLLLFVKLNLDGLYP